MGLSVRSNLPYNYLSDSVPLLKPRTRRVTPRNCPNRRFVAARHSSGFLPCAASTAHSSIPHQAVIPTKAMEQITASMISEHCPSVQMRRVIIIVKDVLRCSYQAGELSRTGLNPAIVRKDPVLAFILLFAPPSAVDRPPLPQERSSPTARS